MKQPTIQQHTRGRQAAPLTATDTPHEHFLVKYLAYGCGLIIALLPFHAFLTVWLSSFIGYYTPLRLWKEVLLLMLAAACASWLIWSRAAAKTASTVAMRGWLRSRPLALLLIAYAVLLVGMGAAALVSHDVTPKAYLYGLLLDARFLLFFVVCWQVSRRFNWLLLHWKQLLLVPAVVVVTFGLLQLVFPVDFLRHFGYGSETIPAVQTVDQKINYQRIQSTLRGANPLGAYLIVIVSAVIALLLQPLSKQRRLFGYAGLTATLVVLGATFSRSAWIGGAAAIMTVVYLRLAGSNAPAMLRLQRLLLISGAVAVLVLAGAGYALRNNDLVQNTLLHTDEHSKSSLSSNQGHLEAARTAAQDIMQQPLGRGTGTAGPASFYNRPQLPRIAENYYLQIGQEIGLTGLLLFVAINAVVAYRLWQRRGQLLALILLASLIGISIVNLLSHAWTDDTLSYIWWGLAGAAMALPGIQNLARGPHRNEST